MEAQWYEATQLPEVLVKKAKGIDENGMDLRFATGNTTFDGASSAPAFVKAMSAARPATSPLSEQAHTDLSRSLRDVSLPYISKLKNNQISKVKDVVLIILTDGIWKGTENTEGVAEHIAKFSKDIEKYDYDSKSRPFSVQLIQFRNDPAATQRKEYMDDFLHEQGIP